MEKIRVIIPTVGGAFGGKTEATPSCLVACLLSRKLGRPVKITYTRQESFCQNKGRHPCHMKMKMGFDDEGHITAVDFDCLLDGGGSQQLGLRRDVVHRGAHPPAVQDARRALPRPADLHQQADPRRPALPGGRAGPHLRRGPARHGRRKAGDQSLRDPHAQRGRDRLQDAHGDRGAARRVQEVPGVGGAAIASSSRSTASCPTAAASAWPAATTAPAAPSCSTPATGPTPRPRSGSTPRPG